MALKVAAVGAIFTLLSYVMSMVNVIFMRGVDVVRTDIRIFGNINGPIASFHLGKTKIEIGYIPPFVGIISHFDLLPERPFLNKNLAVWQGAGSIKIYRILIYLSFALLGIIILKGHSGNLFTLWKEILILPEGLSYPQFFSGFFEEFGVVKGGLFLSFHFFLTISFVRLGEFLLGLWIRKVNVLKTVLIMLVLAKTGIIIFSSLSFGEFLKLLVLYSAGVMCVGLVLLGGVIAIKLLSKKRSIQTKTS